MMTDLDNVSQPYAVRRVDSVESGTSDGPEDAGLSLNGYSDGTASRLRDYNEIEGGDSVLPLRDGPSAGFGPPSSSSSNSAQTAPYSSNPSLTNSYGAPTSSATSYSWSSTQSHPRTRAGGTGNLSNSGTPGMPPPSSRSQRPSATRTPSSAYAPPRRPSQFGLSVATRHRSSSETRTRLNPEADYRAQKKAYVQRLRQDNTDGDMELSSDDYTPSVEYSTDSEKEGESPANEYSQQDSEDPETIMYYGNEETQPSLEELKIPANRERLEWHSMLANVLTGDVVKQEKKRLTGGTEQMEGKVRKAETWMGVRARYFGRTIAAQRRVVEEQRSNIPALIEEVATFEIKGETEVGMDPRQQVDKIVKKIEKIESLYPTSRILKEAHPRVASDEYRESMEAILAWHNTTELINTELGILQAWVGNEELDFLKPREKRSTNDQLVDEASFIERILKEDGLKSLQSNESMIIGVDRVIHKAKETLMMNAAAFSNKHLPPYIEELLTLINFPSRLVQEIIRMRFDHVKKIKENPQQGVLIAEQMISQFQILLSLAVKIKDAYVVVSKPKPGWDLPPCIDENFDSVVLNALRFYFKMLNWKLSANKNTFKEAEILEQEWEYSNELGRHFQGGDVEVAEQFSSLTSKSLNRLTVYFEKELERRPDEVAGPEMDKRYKQILDSVRVRQRKLFRFSRLLSQTFENSVEFNLILNSEPMQEVYDNLVMSGHILLSQTSNDDGKGVTCVIASPTLQDSLLDTESILQTAYRIETTERSEPIPYMYVLVIRPESPIVWEGARADIEIPIPELEIKTGKLRLIADGAHVLLHRAKDAFCGWIGTELDVTVPQRANLPSVDKELLKVKKQAYKLSNTIMDSVENIRKQLAGLECQELIQTCFAFATEFGQRSVMQMDYNRRAMHKLRLTRLALDWVSFICDDCVASDRKTFRWAVVALEFAMVMTTGQNILTVNNDEYARLRSKVSGCMSLLISHFDIMGARSTVAAQAEKQRTLEEMGGKLKLDVTKLQDDEQSAQMVSQQWMEQLEQIDDQRKSRESESKPLGRVLESSTEADRSLTFLSSSATNVTLRWQQGQYIGGGTFGSVYAATNIDSGQVMAVKEIRLQDPQLIPTIVGQIRDEMGVLQILDHPNIVQYYGIEVHRDKVYIFMEYCAGGSLAGLLEHGRIEDETVISVYGLQLVEGLAYLHESQVVHRDIKPENILLDHNGVIKYVDFGAAKIIARQTGRTIANGETGNMIQQGRAAGGQAGNRQGRQKSMTGTPMYMSPEVIRGTTTSASTSSHPGSEPSSPTSPTTSRPGAPDIWSLGCVILEMATGRRPWASLDNEWAIMYNIAQGNSPSLPTKNELSDEGIDFLRRCFERDPSRRATPAELLQHEWLLRLRNQLSLQPTGASDGMSRTGTGSGGNTPASAPQSGGGWIGNGGSAGGSGSGSA